nr:PREDICTED: phospholipase A2 inhibitor subunit gamma B-like [Lepisosteus oculatus]
MKLLLILSLFCGLHCSASTLKCYRCAATGNEICSSQQQLCSSSETVCASSTLVEKSGNTKKIVKARACSTRQDCGEVLSVNQGSVRRISNTSCCTTDLCNNFDVPVVDEGKANRLECVMCSGLDLQCSNYDKVQCLDNEDRCFKDVFTDGQTTLTAKGCASRNVCEKVGAKSLNRTVSVRSYCCKGNLCNSAGPHGLLGPMLPLGLLAARLLQ